MAKYNDSFALTFTPKTKGQKEAVETFKTSEVLFLLGPAGTGKTHVALALALKEIQEKRKKKVIFCRPLVECGETIGFLPGTLEEKCQPYYAVASDVLSHMAFKIPADVIEYKPLTFIRGVTFTDCVAILDEAQNASYVQIKTFLTRLGLNSKIIIVADPEQADVKPTQSEYYTDIDCIVEKLHDVQGVSVIDLPPTQVTRHPLVTRFNTLL